jgi:HAD superfamily hydrolase (TIGR01549 family)
MKYQAILFDLDFTIHDECNYLKEIVVSSRIFDNPEKILNHITYRFRIDSKNIINDILSLDSQLNKKNKNHIFCLMKEINIELSCYNGILEMLNKFREKKNIKVGLVTNGVPEIQRNKLQCLGIERHFDQIIFAKELGSQKPEHLPFEEAIKQFKVDPKLALFVGDHPINDIQSACDVGMDTMWIDHLDNNNMVSTYKITDANILADTITNL